MYIANKRNSSRLKACAPLQPLLELIGFEARNCLLAIY